MTYREYLQMLTHFVCFRGNNEAKKERLKFLCMKFCDEIAKSIKPVCKTTYVYLPETGPQEVSLYCMVSEKRGLMLQPCKLDGQPSVMFREINSLYDHQSKENHYYKLTDLDNCKEFFSKLGQKYRHLDIVM